MRITLSLLHLKQSNAHSVPQPSPEGWNSLAWSLGWPLQALFLLLSLHLTPVLSLVYSKPSPLGEVAGSLHQIHLGSLLECRFPGASGPKEPTSWGGA